MDDILALYEEHQRKNVNYYGMRRERTADVVRLVDQSDWQGMITWSRLDESNADRVIEEQIGYYQGLGQTFEWKLYTHDTPADLKERLIAHGFEVEEAETIMALDLDKAPAHLLEPVTADIRRVTDVAGLGPVVEVMNKVWDEDHSGLLTFLGDELVNHGDYLSIYVAYAGGVPASVAWIRFIEDSLFAELLGGSTLVEYRKQGLYTALLALRAQEALSRGVRFLSIDASAMSAPIVAKYGFEPLTVSYPCNWKVNKGN